MSGTLTEDDSTAEDDAADSVRQSTRKTRNTASPADQEEAILTAAAAEFAEVGLRRANVDEVAARAGVSRSTLYRRFPNKDSLLQAVAGRVYESTMTKLEDAVVGLTAPEALVEAFALGAELVESDPLTRRLVLTDPEIKEVTSSMTALFIDLVAARVAETLRAAGAQMPDADLLEAVEIHVRLVISFLEVPMSDPERQAPDRVREFAAKFLAPMIW